MGKQSLKLSGVTDNALKYAVATAILFVPLYPKFPLFQLPGIAVSLRLEDFIFLAVVAIWFVAVLPHWREFLSRKEVKLVFLFWAVGLVATVAGMVITETVVPHVGLLHWARRVQYLTAFFIGLYAIKRKEDLYFYIKLLFIVVLLAFMYGIGQKYFNVPIITTQNEEYAKGIALHHVHGGHLVSTFAGHYDLAAFTILVLPAFYLLLTSPGKTLKNFVPDTNPVITRGVLLIVSAAALWLLMQTASRISLVAYLLSATVALFIAGRKKFIPVMLIISFIFAATSTSLVERYLNIVTVYANDAVVAIEPPLVEDRSTSIRLNVEWPRAIRAFNKNPITGTGYSSITLATDNGYLRMLGETGALGAASLLLLIGYIWFLVIKNASRAPSVKNAFSMGIFAALFGIMTNMLFIDVLEASKFAILLWFILGFAVSIGGNKGLRSFK